MIFSLQRNKNKLDYSIIVISTLHQVKGNCYLTALDSNFLEAILTLALQQNKAVSNKTDVDR